MKINVISSGSNGNAVIYDNRIMVDCGVSFAKIKPFVNDIAIVLLTHEHKDHISIKTLSKIQSLRPTLRIGCCEWMLPLLSGLNNIDVYEIGTWYNYGSFRVAPIKLYHDVLNCGYRITIDGYKILHATDTAHLEGITAKSYDLYAIEANYDEDKAMQAIAEAEERGEYCHAIGSIKSHLSKQQAFDFIERNRKETSEVLLLHKSNKFY